MTVAQLLPALNDGGVERGTLEVAAALVRHGHRSLVISADGRQVPRLVAEGSKHICWPLGRKSPLTLRWAGRLRRLLVRERVDILHARSRLPAWIAWLAWRGMPDETRPHFVTTVHGLYSGGFYSAVMARGERVITVSNYARDYILSAYPATDSARITVIPRGVDPGDYHHGYRPRQEWLENWYREYPQTAGRYLVTLPGRITRSKGVMDFIEVVQGLRANGVPVHGLITGAQPTGRHRKLGKTIRQRLIETGLDEWITLTGYREDLREILTISGAVVSLSRHPEAFGRTVNEALALGRPVAGYAHGGVGEQLAAQFPEGCIPAGNHDRMVERLTQWSWQAPSMAAVRPCMLERMLHETLQVYEQLPADAGR
ncbi:MAG: glycosyltransferase family 4 protein [Gammaproteobacteria bacterium]|nr:MAG: glycosyltransferase family 4 protein [Gammaproteobacteria bacterium]